MEYLPQLATLVEAAPRGDGWLHEVKFDGYRIGCQKQGRSVVLLSRKGNDWTSEFPEIAAAARKVRARGFLLDGEAAVLLPDGRTSFEALQTALGGGSRAGLTYFVFDLLQLDGRDLRSEPVEKRKERLRELLRDAPAPIRYAEHWAGGGEQVLGNACRLGFEGIVSKQRGSPYRAGRGTGWLKTKCSKRQEFVIGGFTEADGDPSRIGALLVGVLQDGGLVFAGKVGTGYTRALGRELREKLRLLEQRDCPFARTPPGWLGRNAFWVRPRLVAEVAFLEWTRSGQLRHPSFQGLRRDKDAGEVVRERAGRVDVAGVSISNPSRVVFAEAGLTKLELARYHEAVAEHALPHLRGRPLTLVRCGSEIAQGCTFLKHSKVWAPPALRRIRIREKTKLGEYLICDTTEALVSLSQMDVIEIHTWNTRAEHVELPDRIVLDLDPGDEVPFARVVEGARLLRSALSALRLESWVKTTGGRGLHVVVPLKPERDWSECLAFSRALCEAIARQDPRRYTTTYARAGRERLILLDYLRNNRTNTSVAAFSPRAREPAPVSVPVAWDELGARLDPASFTVQTVPRRLARLRKDPWADYFRSRQRLTEAALKAVRSL
ncbi:MAG: DNA ligase D [Myxococcales bacterium]